jgi:hypothetical protein
MYDNNAINGLSDWMRLCFETTSRTMKAMEGMAANPIMPDGFRDARSQAFQAWSDYWEQFLRSAPFLQVQRECAKAHTDSQKQLHELLGRLHHEMQLATSQDIDQVMRALRRIAEDATEHREEIDARLDELAARIDALAASLGSTAQNQVPGNGASKPGENRSRPFPSQSNEVF